MVDVADVDAVDLYIGLGFGGLGLGFSLILWYEAHPVTTIGEAQVPR